MKIIKDVLEYLQEERSGYMGYYTRDESKLYKVAFLFLTIFFCIVIVLEYITLFLTSPIWIVPWLIHRRKSEVADSE